MKRGGERGQEIKNLQVEMKEILAWLMGREKTAYGRNGWTELSRNSWRDWTSQDLPTAE
jgi:hypothetical protein